MPGYASAPEFDVARREVVAGDLSAHSRRSQALTDMARSQRDRARQDRLVSRQLRRDTIRLRWTARQLRCDRYGPVVAVWNGESPEPEESITLDAVINGLFDISVILAALYETLDDGRRDRVRAAIDRLDRIIADIRVAALARQLELREAREEVQRALLALTAKRAEGSR